MTSPVPLAVPDATNRVPPPCSHTRACRDLVAKNTDGDDQILELYDTLTAGLRTNSTEEAFHMIGIPSAGTKSPAARFELAVVLAAEKLSKEDLYDDLLVAHELYKVGGVSHAESLIAAVMDYTSLTLEELRDACGKEVADIVEELRGYGDVEWLNPDDWGQIEKMVSDRVQSLDSDEISNEQAGVRRHALEIILAGINSLLNELVRGFPCQRNEAFASFALRVKDYAHGINRGLDEAIGVSAAIVRLDVPDEDEATCLSPLEVMRMGAQYVLDSINKEFDRMIGPEDNQGSGTTS